ncbi:ABC transporter ATP-binding protein [Anaeropeptidivorans aminofermentans]|uniref:ABC transporter ATP-binding protein n=1 Tax=Anaeropeptidivorans aminofermentans TaxID=2934315 RepID=UPI0020258B48|nr:ABC transporter ATP-binding protein [Anaeropeptidivorans aminofermentans]
MRKIMHYIYPYRFFICIQFIIKFIGTVTDLLLPWLLSYIIDDVVPLKDLKKVYLYGGLMVFFAIVTITFNIIANRMAIKTARNFTKALRHDLFEKVSYLSSHQADIFTNPSLISRLTSDTYNVHQMIDRMQRLGIRAPILLLGGIAITLTLEPVLTLILICILPLLAIIVVFLSRKGVKLYTAAQTALDNLVRKVQENMTGIRVIKALSKLEYEKERFDDINKEVVQNDQRAGTLMALTNPSMNLLLNIGLTAVVVVGAHRVNAGFTQPGKIIAFLSYFAIILNALMMVTRLFVMYSKGVASANRIALVLDAPEDMEVLPSENEAIKSPYHIEFRNVSFSYNKTQNNLTNISFTLEKGQTLGIIGATGSGKSTVLNLLLRFYDTDAGEIFINGKDIRTIPYETLHTQFGVVFQNDFLFADTIRENIDFGRSLKDTGIKEAIDDAQAGFIYEKPGNFTYKLTVKGANLSGGQKQRILIARALAANPEILLLDDSTSALDYLTDAALRKALRENFSDTTTIIVAQRISSIMNADHIMMLEDGEIIGFGTHEELLDSCESYNEIYNTQMGEIS